MELGTIMLIRIDHSARGDLAIGLVLGDSRVGKDYILFGVGRARANCRGRLLTASWPRCLRLDCVA